MMGGCFIWTVAFTLPSNKAVRKAEKVVKQLLQTWVRQHAVQTLASSIASVVALLACM